MKLFIWLKQFSLYIWEGVIRVFSPRDDNYPETGVQPFDGEINEEKDGYA